MNDYTRILQEEREILDRLAAASEDQEYQDNVEDAEYYHQHEDNQERDFIKHYIGEKVRINE